MSEDSSGEAELEAEPDTSDPEDVRDLHPGALLYKASKARNLPVMAEALAHGADVNLVNEEDEGKTPLIQAVTGVSQSQGIRKQSQVRKSQPDDVDFFNHVLDTCQRERRLFSKFCS